MNSEKSASGRKSRSASPQANEYSRIFEQNVDVKEPLSIESIESLFTNMNDIYTTMGASYHSLAQVVSTLYRKANEEKEVSQCKECEVMRTAHTTMRKDILNLKQERQALQIKCQELQLRLEESEGLVKQLQLVEAKGTSSSDASIKVEDNKESDIIVIEEPESELVSSLANKIVFSSKSNNKMIVEKAAEEPISSKSSALPITSKSTALSIKRASKDIVRHVLNEDADELNTGKGSTRSLGKIEKKSPSKSSKKKTRLSQEKNEDRGLGALEKFAFKNPKLDPNQVNQKGFKKRKPNSYPTKEDKGSNKIIEAEFSNRMLEDSGDPSGDPSGESSRKSVSLTSLLDNFLKERGTKEREKLLQEGTDIKETKPADKKPRSLDNAPPSENRNSFGFMFKNPKSIKSVDSDSENKEATFIEPSPLPQSIDIPESIKESSNKSVSTSLPGRKYKSLNNFLISQSSIPSSLGDAFMMKPASATSTKNGPSIHNGIKPRITLPIRPQLKPQSRDTSADDNTGKNTLIERSPQIAEFFKTSNKENDSKPNVVRASGLNRHERGALEGFDCNQCQKFYEAISEGTKTKAKVYCNHCSRHRDYAPLQSTPEVYHHDLTLDSQP